MHAPSSIDEAIIRSKRVELDSRFLEMTLLLEFGGNSVIVTPLLHRRGLEPMRQWLAKGIEFEEIFRVVYTACLSLRPYKIKSWKYFEASVLQRKP